MQANRLRGDVNVYFTILPEPAALLLVVMIISGVGTVAASAQALPGDFLYPVKRAQENVQLTFSPDEASQAGLYLEFASRRIDEALQNRNGPATYMLGRRCVFQNRRRSRPERIRLLGAQRLEPTRLEWRGDEHRPLAAGRVFGQRLTRNGIRNVLRYEDESAGKHGLRRPGIGRGDRQPGKRTVRRQRGRRTRPNTAENVPPDRCSQP